MIIDDKMLEETIKHHIKEYLRENLVVNIDTEYDWDNKYLKVELKLDGEVISSSSISI
jgi:hypothetical protein